MVDFFKLGERLESFLSFSASDLRNLKVGFELILKLSFGSDSMGFIFIINLYYERFIHVVQNIIL